MIVGTLPLIGGEIEELVLLNSAANQTSKDFAVHGRPGQLVVFVEPLIGIPLRAFVVVVCSTVDAVGARLGSDLKMGSAVGALGCVVHGRVDVHLLHGLRRRTWKGLTNGAINRGAGHDLATWIVSIPILANVHGYPAGGHLACGLAVEDVVAGDAVEGEAVAGITLAVCPDCLIAQTSVGSSGVEKIGVDARAQDCSLCQASGAERYLSDLSVAEGVALGGVGLIQQWR